MDSGSDTEDNLSTDFLGFSNIFRDFFDREDVNAGPSTRRPHSDVEDESEPNDTPSAKRRKMHKDQIYELLLSEDTFTVETEDQIRPPAADEIDNTGTAAINDAVRLDQQTEDDTLSVETQDYRDKATRTSEAFSQLLTETKRTSNEVAQKPNTFQTWFDLLDGKTLVKIFDQLDVLDLLNMCDEGERFQKAVARHKELAVRPESNIVRVITEQVLPSQGQLDISTIKAHYSVRHAFKFGGFVPEILVKLSDIQWKDKELSEIEEIVRMLGKRCSGGHLKALTINFDINEPKSCEFRQEVPDCFKTLESLTIIHGSRRSVSIDNCIETLLAGCTGLKYLTLNRIGSNGKFLTALNNIELQELTIDVCTISESKNWLEFIEKGIPTLKSFSWNLVHIPELQFHDNVFNYIKTAFPNIQKLSFNASHESMGAFMAYTTVSQLTELHIKCNKLTEKLVLKALENMPYLLALYVEIVHFASRRLRRWRYAANEDPTADPKTDWINAMKCLTNLHSIKIESEVRFKWEAIIEAMANLPLIQMVHLKSNQPINQASIAGIVSLSPYLACVWLDAPVRASFTPKLYGSLVHDRSRWYRHFRPLDILMEKNYVRYLKREITGYATKESCIRLCPV